MRENGVLVGDKQDYFWKYLSLF